MIVLVFVLLLGNFSGWTQVDDIRANTPVSFTLADRDRIMLTEKRLESFEKQVNERFSSFEKRVNERFDAIDKRFDAQDKRFDDIKSDIGNLYNLMILLLGAMFTLFGFILWDRKSTVRPVQREQEKVIEALRELAKEDKKIAKIFHKAGIL
jgi:hypothetical protein